MKHQLYSMFDSKTGQYRQIQMFQNDGAAERAVTELFHMEQQTDYTKYPEDFTLMHLGEFDDELGLIDIPANGSIRPVCHLWEIRSKLIAKQKFLQAEMNQSQEEVSDENFDG